MKPETKKTFDSVLIRGEKGADKEIMARAIHFNSGSRDGLFVKVDASALSILNIAEILKKAILNSQIMLNKHLWIMAGRAILTNRKRPSGMLNISYKFMLNKIKAYRLAEFEGCRGTRTSR